MRMFSVSEWKTTQTATILDCIFKMVVLVYLRAIGDRMEAHLYVNNICCQIPVKQFDRNKSTVMCSDCTSRSAPSLYRI